MNYITLEASARKLYRRYIHSPLKSSRVEVQPSFREDELQCRVSLLSKHRRVEFLIKSVRFGNCSLSNVYFGTMTPLVENKRGANTPDETNLSPASTSVKQGTVLSGKKAHHVDKHLKKVTAKKSLNKEIEGLQDHVKEVTTEIEQFAESKKHYEECIGAVEEEMATNMSTVKKHKQVEAGILFGNVFHLLNQWCMNESKSLVRSQRGSTKRKLKDAISLVRQDTYYKEYRHFNSHFVEREDIEDAFVVLRRVLCIEALTESQQSAFDAFLDGAKTAMHAKMSQYYEPVLHFPELPQEQVETRVNPVPSTPRSVPSTSGYVPFHTTSNSSSDSESEKTTGSSDESLDSVCRRLHLGDALEVDLEKERQSTGNEENEVPSEEELEELRKTRDRLQEQLKVLQGTRDERQQSVKQLQDEYESLTEDNKRLKTTLRKLHSEAMKRYTELDWGNVLTFFRNQINALLDSTYQQESRQVANWGKLTYVQKLKHVSDPTNSNFDPAVFALHIDTLLGKFVTHAYQRIVNRIYRAHFVKETMIDFVLDELFQKFLFSQLPRSLQVRIKADLRAKIKQENITLNDWKDVEMPWAPTHRLSLVEVPTVFTPTPQRPTPGSGLVSTGGNVAISSENEYEEAEEEDGLWTPVPKRH